MKIFLACIANLFLFGNLVFCETNIAEGKPTSSSSSHELYPANKANDGTINSMFISGDKDEFPWWTVNLLESYEIEKINVYTRPYFQERFHDVRLTVSSEDICRLPPHTVFNPGNSSICKDNIGADKAVQFGWTTFECEQPITGQYVSFQIIADCKPGRTDCNYGAVDTKQRLELMEVEIYGKPIPAAKPDTNIAEGKPSLSSSEHPLYPARNANDGAINTMSITDTADTYPWWRVDMRRVYEIGFVKIYQRPEFERRFHDVRIVVSNEDISKLPSHTVFNPGKESVCKDNIGTDKVVASKWNTFNCEQPTVGRYLSVQIIADCKPGRKDCNYKDDDTKHRLELQEVQIFGKPVPVVGRKCKA